MITDIKWLDWEKQKFKETQVKRRVILSIRGVSQNLIASSTTWHTNPSRSSGSIYLPSWAPHPCFSLTSISSFCRTSWWFCSSQSLPSTIFHHVIWFNLLLLKEKEGGGERKKKRERERKREYLEGLSWVWLLSCVRLLCDPMDYRMPGFPVHHHLPELAQTHVHRVGDAIQPLSSYPLSFPSLPTLNLSQHQGLFQWVSSLRQMAKYWRFSFSISPSNEYSGLISFRMDWLDLLAVQDSQVFSNTTIQMHQFFGTQLSLWSNSHIHTWLLEKP